MIIIKSQGQTFNVAGLHLSVECFSRGQLYVALSRVTSKENMFVLSNDKEDVNFVLVHSVKKVSGIDDLFMVPNSNFRSKVKVMLTVFFDYRVVVHSEFLPEGQTVNKEYYLSVMRHLREQKGQICVKKILEFCTTIMRLRTRPSL